jgi:competence protein ComEC
MFIQEISKRPQAVYHSALFDFGNHPVSFAAKACYGEDLPAVTIVLPHGSRIDQQPIPLGAGASMTFLHADGSSHNSFNENSLVVRLDLGPARILIMGDAEAGSRADPSTPPADQSIEGILLTCCSAQARADVLIVGHHGSKTSSRASFLNAVGATRFVVSSGPMKYGSVVLPDLEVIKELESRGTVFRTDLNDDTCDNNPAKIGPDNDGKAGGCDNVRIVLNSSGELTMEYFGPSD